MGGRMLLKGEFAGQGPRNSKVITEKTNTLEDERGWVFAAINEVPCRAHPPLGRRVNLTPPLSNFLSAT